VLREDATDPRLRLVSLTRVDVAPDLTQALVFWSVMEGQGAPSVDEAQTALSGAAAYLRRLLARELRLRYAYVDARLRDQVRLGSQGDAANRQIIDRVLAFIRKNTAEQAVLVRANNAAAIHAADVAKLGCESPQGCNGVVPLSLCV